MTVTNSTCTWITSYSHEMLTNENLYIRLNVSKMEANKTTKKGYCKFDWLFFSFTFSGPSYSCQHTKTLSLCCSAGVSVLNQPDADLPDPHNNYCYLLSPPTPPLSPLKPKRWGQTAAHPRPRFSCRFVPVFLPFVANCCSLWELLAFSQ